MTLQEFKAWFEGFTEGFGGVPNKKQWERIKERVGQIDGMATSHTIFVDRYWPTWPTYPRPYWYSNNFSTTAGSHHNAQTQTVASYSSTDAFRCLGQADAHAAS